MKVLKSAVLILAVSLIAFWLIGMIRNYMREAKLAQA